MVYLYFAFWFSFLERYNEMTGEEKGRRKKQVSIQTNRVQLVNAHGALQPLDLLWLVYFPTVRHMVEKITGTESGGGGCPSAGLATARK